MRRELGRGEELGLWMLESKGRWKAVASFVDADIYVLVRTHIPKRGNPTTANSDA